MNYENIREYIILIKQLMILRETRGFDDIESQAEEDVLLDKMDDTWNRLTNEETLMAEKLFQLELAAKNATGEWLDNEWFMPDKEDGGVNY